MEPSSSSDNRSPGQDQIRPRAWIVLADRAALVGLAIGLALYVMPFWKEGRLRVAFWLTLISTLLHVYTSHKAAPGGDDQR